MKGRGLCSSPLLEIEARNNLYIHPGRAYVSIYIQSDNSPFTTDALACIPEQGERILIPYIGVKRTVQPNKQRCCCHFV